MSIRASDENNDIAGKIDPVNINHPVHLPGGRSKRPDPPKFPAMPTKATPPARHIRLPGSAHQPGKKHFQLLGRVINPTCHAHPA